MPDIEHKVTIGGFLGKKAMTVFITQTLKGPIHRSYSQRKLLSEIQILPAEPMASRFE
jgi:hypothetical protein